MEGQGQKVLTVSEDATKELELEYLYYAYNYSIEAAEKLRMSFNTEIQTVLPNPYIYPECRFLPTKTQMYRNIVWGNYLIIYRIKKNSVVILSLFHTSQKPVKIRLVKKRGH